MRSAAAANSAAPGNRGSIKAPTFILACYKDRLPGPAGTEKDEPCDTAIYPQLK